MPRPPRLSKSRFTYGLQCHKHLWWRVHDAKAPELRPDALTRSYFERGHRVGEAARDHLPGGHLIPYDGRQRKKAIEATREAIDGGKKRIYEAAFEYEDLFAAIDILDWEEAGWVLVEVKSSTSPKPQHVQDAAVQAWILRRSGQPVSRVEVMHLDGDCIFPDLSNLFARKDVTREVESFLPQVAGEVSAQKAMLAGSLPPVEPGDHCETPYPCPFFARCNAPLPEGHVRDLHRVGRERATLWLDRGVDRIRDVPAEEIDSNPIWQRQYAATTTTEPVVSAGLNDALPSPAPGQAYLDFETLAPAIPVWEGCRPFDPVPAQFSLHVRRSQGSPEHHGWLAEGDDDPRPRLATVLAKLLRPVGSIFAYNASFERRCLEDLARAAGSGEESVILQEASERLVDLLPIVRNHVYHHRFRGSFGLKSVLGALAPELDYDYLPIADGQLASAELETLLLRPDSLPAWRRRQITRHLETYCDRDTEALVWLHDWLEEKKSRHPTGH